MNYFLIKKSQLACLLFCIAHLIAFSATIQAQTNTGHEGWYQVEMIVFVRKTDLGQEHWPSNIKLRYPNNWVELKDPNVTSASGTMTSGTMNSGENPTGAIADTQTAATNTAIDLTKEEFYLLPSSERQLNAEATKLVRDSRFEVVFHQAWRQVIGHKNQAKNIIITGGKQFGQHQELEGTINLSVATYLKLQTNLWFSQFDVNIGQEQTIPWPEIPVRPNYNKFTNSGLTLDADVELAQALAKENNSWNNGDSTINPAEQDAFVTRQIILVKQARDMRSDELHYVDHPVVGIIIKVTPYN